mmetsp:Transcript_19738/g.35071  ORF Transcript_19738/g.35071 Transcript_19738/m.35071 type:complete len:310 (+) Transcript_19738:425-1354(+)
MLQLLVALHIFLCLLLKLSHDLLLLEEDLIGSSGLLFQHLLLLQFSLILLIRTCKVFFELLVTLHQVTQRIFQRTDFLLSPSDLVVQLVAPALQLFLFLSSLDHVVSLAHILLSIFFLHLAHDVLVLALQSVDLLLPLGKFDGCLVPLLLGRSELGAQDLCVNLDLLLTLLHTDVKLLFSVLQAVQVLRLGVEVLLQALDLQTQDVVLHQSFFLVLDSSGHCSVHDRVLQFELFHDSLHALAILLDIRQISRGILQLGILTLDLRHQDGMVTLLFFQLCVKLLNLAIELILLLDGALTRDTGYLALHEL